MGSPQRGRFGVTNADRPVHLLNEGGEGGAGLELPAEWPAAAAAAAKAEPEPEAPLEAALQQGW